MNLLFKVDLLSLPLTEGTSHPYPLGQRYDCEHNSVPEGKTKSVCCLQLLSEYLASHSGSACAIQCLCQQNNLRDMFHVLYHQESARTCQSLFFASSCTFGLRNRRFSSTFSHPVLNCDVDVGDRRHIVSL